jgi:hypothetical protein
VKSKILYLICIAYFVSGYSVYTTKAPLALIRQADPSITAHTDIFTLHEIGLVFMIGTSVSIILGLLKKVEWAFSLMTFIITWWALLFLVSWARTGYWQSIYSFVNYALVASLLIMVSNIVEMPKTMQKPEQLLGSQGYTYLDKKEDGSR